MPRPFASGGEAASKDAKHFSDRNRKGFGVSPLPAQAGAIVGRLEIALGAGCRVASGPRQDSRRLGLAGAESSALQPLRGPCGYLPTLQADDPLLSRYTCEVLPQSIPDPT